MSKCYKSFNPVIKFSIQWSKLEVMSQNCIWEFVSRASEVLQKSKAPWVLSISRRTASLQQSHPSETMSANAELQSSQLPKSKNPDLSGLPMELSCSFSPILLLGWLSLMHHHLLTDKQCALFLYCRFVFHLSEKLVALLSPSSS